MNINSKRFKVVASCHHLTAIRDMNAPYHCHHVNSDLLPSVEQLAFMNEESFDRIMFDLVYNHSV